MTASARAGRVAGIGVGMMETGVFRLLAGLARPPFRGPMLAASLGLAASLMVDAHVDLPGLCSGADIGLADLTTLSRIVLLLNAPDRVALAWLTMLVAMMTPLIALQLFHVRRSSLVSRRWRAMAGFLLGYFGCWLIAGLPIIAGATVLRLTGGSATSLAAALFLALLWSASPMRQIAQNRGHRLRRIGLFGLAADRDCFLFGAVHGWWCVASCWAWMLVPLVVMQGHVAVMLAVTAIIATERMGGCAPPRWRWPPALSLPAAWLRLRAGAVLQGR